MKRWIGTLALVGTALGASPALAQEIQIRGPLAGARAVSRMVNQRDGRLALTPTFGITIQDEFSRELFAGLRAEYHLTDWLGIGLWGAYAVAHIDTALTEQIVARSPGGTTNVPVASQFANQIGHRDWFADLHLTFIPLRGKFALFGSLVADVDFYIFAGPAVIGVQERHDYASTGNLANRADHARVLSITRPPQPPGEAQASQLQRSDRVAVTGTFGFGLNFYFNRFLSLNLEYRAFPFAWNSSGTDEATAIQACGTTGREACPGMSDLIATYFPAQYNRPNDPTSRNRTVIDGNDQILHFNQMVVFGLSFYLPPRPRIGP